jgi:hypothetical protein
LPLFKLVLPYHTYDGLSTPFPSVFGAFRGKTTQAAHASGSGGERDSDEARTDFVHINEEERCFCENIRTSQRKPQGKISTARRPVKERLQRK